MVCRTLIQFERLPRVTHKNLGKDHRCTSTNHTQGRISYTLLILYISFALNLLVDFSIWCLSFVFSIGSLEPARCVLYFHCTGDATLIYE